MKFLQQTWRWFGPSDAVSLQDIKQAGATGIVHALHHIPNGDVWTEKEIKKRQNIIREEGLQWTVVESLPVTEDIKQQTGNWLLHIDNYIQSMENLAACGIDIITYNFMPLLDWTRTDLTYKLEDGSLALRYDRTAMAAFELYVLKRPNAESSYTKEQQHEALQFYTAATEIEIQNLTYNIIAGLPGAEEGYTLHEFRNALAKYDHIDEKTLANHLVDFLKRVCPVAEKLGVKLTIHPDDPPFSVLGLPRIMSTQSDIAFIIEQVPSSANGICYCTGSLGARPDNDLIEILESFHDRIHFVHLRSTKRDEKGNFYEADHLDGDVDMYRVMQFLSKIQQSRSTAIPFRPDHGHQMLDDLASKESNPGYTAIGRLRGLAELRGLEYGIVRANSHS